MNHHHVVTISEEEAKLSTLCANLTPLDDGFLADEGAEYWIVMGQCGHLRPDNAATVQLSRPSG
eukprot:scaffold2552_cov380-Prasinococcus_capsulatus_cf.AAC.5